MTRAEATTDWVSGWLAADEPGAARLLTWTAAAREPELFRDVLADRGAPVGLRETTESRR